MSTHSKKSSRKCIPLEAPPPNPTLVEKYQKLRWSKLEANYLKRQEKQETKTDVPKYPVTLVLKNRIRKSCFGRFLSNFNKDQCQNKFYNYNKYEIEKWDYQHSHGFDKKDWHSQNDVSNKLIPLIKKATLSQEEVSYKYVKQNLEDARMTENGIYKIDKLHKLKILDVLSIPKNWVKKVRAKYLPKTLEFLELDTNEITNLKTLCKKKCPERILHLGLGRNRLTNDSCFHLLETSDKFRRLHTLDLANNGILRLSDLLQELSPLATLTALALEGNPCYTCVTYKSCILNTFPHLIYLDYTEVLPQDHVVEENVDLGLGAKQGALTFTCYRLIGLPTPPKGNVVHYFYLELILPLLAVKPKPKKVEPVKVEPEKASKKGKKGKKAKKEKKPKKEKPPKPVKGKGVYGLPDEYSKEFEEKNTNFKTNLAQWAPVIKFNSPAVTIPPPRNNLLLLRDTLRSRVQILVIYLQCVKAKKGKKSKAAPDISQEVVLKKSTFARFYCDLYPVNWSDQYIDFIWADCAQITELALAIEGNLKADIYEEPSKKGGKPKPPKKPKVGKDGKLPLEKVPLPKMITLNVGFGLKRSEVIPPKPPKSQKKK